MFLQGRREEAEEKERQISEVMGVLSREGRESFYNVYVYQATRMYTLKHFTILYVNYTSIILFICIHICVYVHSTYVCRYMYV